MFEVASQIVINLIIACFIGFIAGYIVANRRSKIKAISSDKNENPIDDPKIRTSINPIFKKGFSVDNKPLVLSFPKSSGKDNLKKIKGINSKIETELNNLGIYHFEQIAKWSNKNCDWIESFLDIPGCAKNNQWIEQAKILQCGNETIYSQKVEDGEIEVD